MTTQQRSIVLTVAGLDLRLDRETVADVLKENADNGHAVGCLKLDLAAAIVKLDQGLDVGILPDRLTVRGVPVADYIAVDDLALLFRLGAMRYATIRKGSPPAPAQATIPLQTSGRRTKRPRGVDAVKL